MQQIIDDHHVFQVPVFNNSQILDEETIFRLHAVFSGENITYVFVFWIDMINYSVCVVLRGSCEDDDLILLTHILKEFH